MGSGVRRLRLIVRPERIIVMAVLGITLTSCAPASPSRQAEGLTFDERLRRAELGDPVAQYDLGLAYGQGREIARDLAESARWLRRAADQGHAEAQNDLGGLYANGWGVPRDDAEAARWFRRAADQGSTNAQRNVGLIYLEGRGVPQDDVEAMRWLLRAAEKGHAVAQRNMGQAYAAGRGVPRDDVEAVTWFRRAAEQEDASAQYNLGVLYFRGRGIRQDDAEAAHWWRRAAAQEHATAQNDLGYSYYLGRGVSQDDGEAVVWFHQAARQGLAIAQKNLAFAYESGRGVPRDLEEAARWYGKAAAQGRADAQTAMGLLHEHGRGVPQDPVRAYLWYHLASAQGDTAAVGRRDDLTGRMTPAQLDEARRLAMHVKPGHEALAVRPATDSTPLAPAPTDQATPETSAGLIPREALLGAGPARSPRLSPDGRRLAYIAAWKGVDNIWLRTVDEHDDRPLTRETERDIRYLRWQCDGEHLLFLHDRDGDESTRLYQIALESGATRDLTPAGVTRVEGVAFEHLCNDPDSSLFAVFAGTAMASVYRADLRAGTLVPDTENPGDVIEWLADRERRVRAALVRTPSGETIVQVREHPRAPWRILQRWDSAATGSLEGFTADGRKLLLTSSVGAPARRLVQVDLTSDRSTVLAEDHASDIDASLTHVGTLEPQAVRVLRARAEWTLLDSRLKDDFDALRRLRDGDLDVESRDSADRLWIVSFVVDDRPPTYYFYDRATQRAAPVFPGKPDEARYRFARMRPISLSARDGRGLHGYLTLPVGVEARNLPLVLLVHGGPWDRDVWGFNPVVQWLANRGYAVLQVNFRGSAGYGKAHLQAGDREWGGRMLDDLLDARLWAVQQRYADPGKVCVMGGSYGGYASLVGLAFAPEAFACGVSLAGVSHLPNQVRSRKPGTPGRWHWERHVGPVAPDDAFLRARSPVHHVRSIKSPILIAHGTNDVIVTRVQSDVMVAALRKHEKPVMYLVLPGDGHALAETFLARVLGGRAEPPSAREEWEVFLR